MFSSRFSVSQFELYGIDSSPFGKIVNKWDLQMCTRPSNFAMFYASSAMVRICDLSFIYLYIHIFLFSFRIVQFRPDWGNALSQILRLYVNRTLFSHIDLPIEWAKHYNITHINESKKQTDKAKNSSDDSIWMMKKGNPLKFTCE